MDLNPGSLLVILLGRDRDTTYGLQSGFLLTLARKPPNKIDGLNLDSFITSLIRRGSPRNCPVPALSGVSVSSNSIPERYLPDWNWLPFSSCYWRGTLRWKIGTFTVIRTRESPSFLLLLSWLHILEQGRWARSGFLLTFTSKTETRSFHFWSGVVSNWFY